MKTIQLKIFSAAFSLMAMMVTPSFAEVAVIVNPQNLVSEISVKDLKHIYRTKKTTWSTGEKIEVVNLKKEDSVRVKFSNVILKKTPAKMEKYYLKRALKGKGQAPKLLNSSSDIKEFVKNNKGAIGYIDVNDVDDEVKVLSIDGKKQIN
ncbi:MAG: substrate-binding domain-containing protein [Sulfurimonas sp.]|nr:substrate-binding domain-containing protein [Sulfurimonas sp.]